MTQIRLCGGWERGYRLRLDQWDAHSEGNYRYAALRNGEEIAAFYGSLHEVRPSERLV